MMAKARFAMYNYFYRGEGDGDEFYTDLAVERRKADTECRGVEYIKEPCHIGIWERVCVRSEEGARSIGRPCGTYDTLTVERLDLLEDESLFDVQEELARRLCILFDERKIVPDRLLVVGLGNAAVSADTVGPRSAGRIKPTMHIADYDAEFFRELECSEIAVLTPGVPALTGMDTATTVRAVCEAIRPDAVIAVDAVSTRSRTRLGRCFQISDTGLFPGGMGNLKRAITEGELGVPVVAVGVPTVMDARLFTARSITEEFDFEPLFVSPREIDEITAHAAMAIGGAINQAFGMDY